MLTFSCALALAAPLAGVVAWCPVSVYEVQQHPFSKPDERLWREARNCGINCLYVLLHARGIEVAYDEVVKHTAVGPSGSSLQDLVVASKALGLPVAAYKTTWEHLIRMELPVLMHLDSYSGDANVSGHFMLLTRVARDKKEIEVFDAGTALRHVMAAAKARKLWSGYVLIEEREWDGTALCWVLSCAGLGLVAYLMYRGRRP